MRNCQKFCRIPWFFMWGIIHIASASRSVCPCLSVSMSVCLYVCLSLCLCVFLPVFLSIYKFLCLCVSLYVCLCLPASQSVCLSFWLSVCVSVSLFVSKIFNFLHILIWRKAIFSCYRQRLRKNNYRKLFFVCIFVKISQNLFLSQLWRNSVDKFSRVLEPVSTICMNLSILSVNL
jgi:hypothetical protein